MGNVGFCFSMYPVLKKLYPDKKDLAAAMKRHLTLYQTSHYLATFQMGITAAMEEENAQDADFDTDSIGAVKTALMGPIAGIGDSLFWGTIKVIATGIGCSLALQGNILGLYFLMGTVHITTDYRTNRCYNAAEQIYSLSSATCHFLQYVTIKKIIPNQYNSINWYLPDPAPNTLLLTF